MFKSLPSFLKISSASFVITTGVLIIQVIQLETNYDPLPVPRGVTKGIEFKKEKTKKNITKSSTTMELSQSKGNISMIPMKRRIGTIIYAGDSLVAGVGCTKEDAVFPSHITKTLAEHSDSDIHWQAYSDVGGDVQALHRMLIHQVVVPNILHDNKINIINQNLNKINYDNNNINNGQIQNNTNEVKNNQHPDQQQQQEHQEGHQEGQEHPYDHSPSSSSSSPSPSSFSPSNNLKAVIKPQDNHHQHPINVMILMCGLNDFKRIYLGKTPYQFYHDLKSLIININQLYGKDNVHIILPALPIHWAIAFPEPLYSLILLLCYKWDDIKNMLSVECKEDINSDIYGSKIDFIKVPPRWPSDILCRDGVHPNERGYRLWGEHIAGEVHKVVMTDRLSNEPPSK